MNAPDLSSPVVIVGAGPVGLALALDLGQRGIRSILFDEKDPDTAPLPSKAGTLNARTLELCRQWGVAGAVRDWGADPSYPRDNVFLQRLSDDAALARTPVESAAERPLSPHSPEVMRKCPQYVFDPILEGAALRTGAVDIRYGLRFTGMVETSEGVTVSAETKQGEQVRFDAAYLVGCDGVGSSVRKAAGIPFEGRLLDYSVTAVLDIENFDYYHQHGRAERFLFMDEEGVWCNATSMDYDRIWRFTFLGFDSLEAAKIADVHWLIDRALGDLDVPFRLEGTAPWMRSQFVAGTYGGSRVLLAGDAAHTMSPTGGHGLNTGLGDVSALGWMLAAVLQGWGGPALLDAYTAERRPVAIRNGDASSRNYTVWTVPVTGAEDAAARERAQSMAEGLKEEWYSDGIAFGYSYAGSSVVVDDGSLTPVDEVMNYVPTGRPGHRAPHFEFVPGVSILDRFGDGFVLVCFESLSEAQKAFMFREARRRNLPLEIIESGDEVGAQLYGGMFALVRPDGHVCWRGNSLPTSPGDVFDIVRGATVARASEEIA